MHCFLWGGKGNDFTPSEYFISIFLPSLSSLLNGFLSNTSSVARGMQDKMWPDTEKFKILVVFFTGPKLCRNVDSVFRRSQMCGRPTLRSSLLLGFVFQGKYHTCKSQKEERIREGLLKGKIYSRFCLFLHVFILCVCDCTCVCHGTCVQVRGQITGVSSLLLLRETQGSNSGHHALKWASLTCWTIILPALVCLPCP